MDDVKIDRNNGRTADGRFTPGNPGRPKGTRHRTTVMAEALMEDGAEAVVTTVIEAAKRGDMTAAKMILDRLVPARKGRAVEIGLPEVKTAADVLNAMSTVLARIGEGEITPEEGATITSVLETTRWTLELVELEVRLAAVEQIVQGNSK